MTTIHVNEDGCRYEMYARGQDRVCVLLGRDSGRKVTRLMAAGFVWVRAGRSNDVADIVLPGDDWMADDQMPECIVSGRDRQSLIALALGRK